MSLTHPKLEKLPRSMAERVHWMHDCLRSYGYMNLVHLRRMFGVTSPTAIATVAAYRENVGELLYSKRLQVFFLPDSRVIINPSMLSADDGFYAAEEPSENPDRIDVDSGVQPVLFDEDSEALVSEN